MEYTSRHHPDQPTARVPFEDLAAYNGELIMVVGCGRQPDTHPNEPHRVPQGNAAKGKPVEIPLAAAYTMDIRVENRPHRHGSFWIADHTEDLPARTFHLIYFEQLPATLFNEKGWAMTAMRAVHRLLIDPDPEHGRYGSVIVRSAPQALAQDRELYAAMQKFFGNVSERTSEGQTVELRATKQTTSVAH